MKTRTIQAGLIIFLSLASLGCQTHSVQMTSGKKYSHYANYDATELIEAHAKKQQEAKEFLSKAQEIHEVDEIKENQSFIIREIESLIKSSEK